MIIRINDKNGNNIAECDLYHHDIGIWNANSKSNISNIYGDIIQTEQGFDDVIDIDIDNIMPQKQIDEETKLLMKLKNSFNEEFDWTSQALDEYIGYCSTFGGDYVSYIAEAINKCFDALINDFFKYDGCNWNSEEEYRYDELDYFLSTLHPLLDKCLNY